MYRHPSSYPNKLETFESYITAYKRTVLLLHKDAAVSVLADAYKTMIN